jgi:hypothetical protein
MNDILFLNVSYNLKFKNLKIDFGEFNIAYFIKNKNIEGGLQCILSELKMPLSDESK